MILNLACGENRINGAVNIDILPSADVQLDILNLKSKYLDESADQVFLFHTIEHIQKVLQEKLICDIWDVLKPDGVFFVAYPEFERCAQNWINNKDGLRDFWEMTIYGRQTSPGDYHITLMDSREFRYILEKNGFKIMELKPEIAHDYNTLVICRKVAKPKTRDEIVRETLFQCH